MPSQTVQLSFGVTVLLLFIGILVAMILIGTAIKAMGTITTFCGEMFRRPKSPPKTEDQEEEEDSSETTTKRRRRVQDEDENDAPVAAEEWRAERVHICARLIVGLHPANERRRCK